MAEQVLHVPLFQKFVVLAMTWAAFGPYVTGSIRTEQAAVYGLLVLLLPFTFVRFHPQGGMKLLLPMVAVAAVGAAGVIFPSRLQMPWMSGDALAGLDNLLLPIAVMVTIWCVIQAEHAPSLLRSAGRVIVWLTAINGALAVISTNTNTEPILGMFWGSASAEGESTAFYAAQLGRYSGIFNQPAEAGVMYGIAALLSIYLYQHHSLKLTVALTLITLGGLISVSKVFILGGIPLMVIYLWKSRTAGGKVGFLASTLLLMAGISQTPLFQSWSGFNYLARLIAPAESQSLIEFYTAGRWNEGSSLTTVIGEVMQASPLVGVGADGLQVPLDSGWTEVIVVAGALGAVAHLALLLGVFVLAKQTVDTHRRHLTYFLGLFMVGADLGISAFTANRVATVAWVLLALLVLAARNTSPDTPNVAVKKRAKSLPPAYRHMKRRQAGKDSYAPVLDSVVES